MRVQVQRVDGSAVDVGTVYAIGRNYAAHARELGNAVPAPTDDPVVFLKARTAVRGLEPAPLAFPDESFHHEVEIVLLLGEDVSLGGSPGWAAVAGVALGLDLTRREVQARCKERGLPWVPAKVHRPPGAASVISNRSPLRIGPTPSGVPVNTRSPASSGASDAR